MTFSEFIKLPPTFINEIINRYAEHCYDNGFDDATTVFEHRKNWKLFDDFLVNEKNPKYNI